MDKKNFMLEYRKKLGIKDLKKVNSKVNNFWDSWFEVLQDKKSLNIKNFGGFEVKNVKSKEGVSPFGKYKTTSSKKIKFTIGKGFREKLK